MRASYVRESSIIIPLAVAIAAGSGGATPSGTLSANHEKLSGSVSSSGEKLSGAKYGSHLEPILKSVDATPEQRAKITAIVNEFRPKIQPTMIQYHEKRDQLLAAIGSGKCAEDIMIKQDEVGQLFSHITNEYCVMHLKVRRCLNPDQVTKYESYRRSQGWVK